MLHNKRLSAKYKFAKAIQNKSNFKLYFRKITMKSSARTQKDSTLQRSHYFCNRNDQGLNKLYII